VSARDRPHRGGCYAEYNATPESSAYALPDGADLDQAAALANYQVAYHLLYDCITFKKGQSVLIQGAAGGTGSVLVDLARHAGIDIIATCGGATKVAFVKSLGVEHVIDRKSQDVSDAVAAATRGKGIDFIMDFAGGPEFVKNFAMLAPYGTVVSYGQLAGKPRDDVYAALRAQSTKSLALRVFSIHIYDHWREPQQAGMRWLIERLGRGALKLPHASLRVCVFFAMASYSQLNTRLKFISSASLRTSATAGGNIGMSRLNKSRDAERERQ
jgi:NADPH2:quinone reductase